MDKFEKISLIVNGRLKERSKELERSKRKESDPYGHNPLYILGVEHEVIMLRILASDIDAIERNHLSVRDEMILRMYGGGAYQF